VETSCIFRISEIHSAQVVLAETKVQSYLFQAREVSAPMYLFSSQLQAFHFVHWIEVELTIANSVKSLFIQSIIYDVVSNEKQDIESGL
jgi:hypothetical protein